MAFDLADPFHAHAYFALGFWCASCDEALLLTSRDEPPSDAWCIAAADQARAAGWRLPAPLPDGSLDVWSAYCPICARGRADLVD